MLTLPSPIRTDAFAGKSLLLATASALVMLAAAPAWGQASGNRGGTTQAAPVTTEEKPGEDVSGERDAQRTAESYQPKGIELGSFLLLPQLEVEETYNSNVFAAETDVRDDFITKVTPEFTLRSRFPVHALNVRGRAEQYFFSKYSSDDRLDLNLNADARYDVTRTWEFRSFVDAFERAEDRGAPDAARGRKPTDTRGATGRFGSSYRFDRLRISGDVGAHRKVFDDVATSGGAPVDNSDRNRWEYSADVRGSYELFPGYAGVVRGAVNRREFTSAVDRNGLDRDSKGYRLETGIGVDLSQLVRGDFTVGYLNQDYEDPRLRDPSGLSFQASFNWTPSRLTVVVPSVERSVQDTTQRTASSIVRTSASLLVRHELRRNIILTGYGSVGEEKYKGAGQNSWTYEARTRVLYALAPEYYVGAELGHKARSSDIAAQDFKQSIVSIRLGVRL